MHYVDMQSTACGSACVYQQRCTCDAMLLLMLSVLWIKRRAKLLQCVGYTVRMALYVCIFITLSLVFRAVGPGNRRRRTDSSLSWLFLRHLSSHDTSTLSA